ncbi:saccharopine dehydrogenase C-terminal domain-containing protein [Myroides sp. LJL115]
MAKHILLIGGGRSTNYLIQYLLDNAPKYDYILDIADYTWSPHLKTLQDSTNLCLHTLDINTPKQIDLLIRQCDIVLSMVPVHAQYTIALKCLEYNKNLVTASYVSEQMQQLDQKVKQRGLLFLNEIGLDPGIDHLSTMHLLDQLKQKKAKVLSYKSHCGGLLSENNCDNLWNYKFTWNPTNVVLAGSGGPAKFLWNNKLQYIPYTNLFKRAESLLNNPLGDFEVYFNRDSCKYQKIYGLDNIQTMQRTTIRRPGFCKAWSVLVDLGLTDNTYYIENTELFSNLDFISLFVPSLESKDFKTAIEESILYTLDQQTWLKILELDLFNANNKLALKRATPAQLMEQILLKKWTLSSHEKDMVLMHHQIEYKQDHKYYQLDSTMHCIGEDSTFTAMAKTVGLPLGIAALRILTKQVDLTGVQIPVSRQLYEPILKELDSLGIEFKTIIREKTL